MRLMSADDQKKNGGDTKMSYWNEVGLESWKENRKKKWNTINCGIDKGLWEIRSIWRA